MQCLLGCNVPPQVISFVVIFKGKSFNAILNYFYQEDAREAAKDEQERIQIVMEVSDSDVHG